LALKSFRGGKSLGLKRWRGGLRHQNKPRSRLAWRLLRVLA
jgi:ribosomal protein L35